LSPTIFNPYRYASAGVDLSDLKTYWKFNELDGGEVKNVATDVGSSDSLGSGADCTVNGMTIDGSSASPFGYAGAFDGSNDYLQAGTSLSQFNFMHNATMVWSINYWFYSNIGTVQQVFNTMSDTSGSNRGYSHSLPPSSAGDDDLGWACGIYTGTPPQYPIAMEDLGSIFSEGDWHMSTGTLDYSLGSDNLKYYADGSEEGTTTQGYTGDNGNSQLAGMIGTRNASARWFDGGICEMSIWNRVLTPDEITSLYNSGNGLEL
jgi:hypothetical protein